MRRVLCILLFLAVMSMTGCYRVIVIEKIGDTMYQLIPPPEEVTFRTAKGYCFGFARKSYNIYHCTSNGWQSTRGGTPKTTQPAKYNCCKIPLAKLRTQ